MNPKYGDAPGEICPVCKQLVGPEPRQIRFSKDDFDPFFESEGIDPDTLTDSEWRAFENMFVEGTGWTEVAREAAWNINQEREQDCTF